MSGIYTITNIINSKIYVGYATDLNTRLLDHKKELGKNAHKNEHLQNAWNKYKANNFRFEILEQCSEEFLQSQENYWCNMLNTHNRDYGYNIRLTSPIGRGRHSKESIDKIIKTITGRECSKEKRKRISISNKGKKRSQLIRDKMSTLKRQRIKRPNVILDKDGNFLNKFDTIIEASEFIKCKGDVLRNTYRTKRYCYKDHYIIPQVLYYSEDFKFDTFKRKKKFMGRKYNKQK